VTPAAQLAALADEELTLVTDGRVDELAGLAARREQALAVLEARGARVADPGERMLLEHAVRVQALAAEAIRAAMARTSAQGRHASLARTAAQGYRAAAGH
jgi:hypothetical protein